MDFAKFRTKNTLEIKMKKYFIFFVWTNEISLYLSLVDGCTKSSMFMDVNFWFWMTRLLDLISSALKPSKKWSCLQSYERHQGS